MKSKEEILFETIKGYNQIDVMKDFEFVITLAMLMAMSKGNFYQDSWCKKGMFSASQNLERKWNRIENILFGVPGKKGLLQGNTEILESDETIIDTLMDLGVYCFLTVVWFWQQGKRQENFKEGKQAFETYIDKLFLFMRGHFPIYSEQSKLQPDDLFLDFVTFIRREGEEPVPIDKNYRTTMLDKMRDYFTNRLEKRDGRKIEE